MIQMKRTSFSAGQWAFRKPNSKMNPFEGLNKLYGTVNISGPQGPSRGAATPASLHTVSEEAGNGWKFCLHVLNAVCCPAIAIDTLGFVLSANRAMGRVLNEDIRIKNRRLSIAD